MNAMSMRIFFALQLFAVSCGDDPLSSKYPEIEGTYAGELYFLASPGGYGVPAHLLVEQEQAKVTISGTMRFPLRIREVPAVTGTIDTSGVFSMTSGRTLWTDGDFFADCGSIRNTVFTVSFPSSSRTMSFNLHTESDFCRRMRLDGTLAREQTD